MQMQLKGPRHVDADQLADAVAPSVRARAGAADVGLSSRGQKPELA